MAITQWLREELVHNSSIALKRFPFTLAFAVAATFVSIAVAEKIVNGDDAYRFLLICFLGVPLSFSIYLYCERNEITANISTLLQLGLILLLSFYFALFLPPHPGVSVFIRYGLVVALAHLVVSFAGYSRNTSLGSFWQFNRTLFTRFVITSIFSSAIYIGLVIAFFAIDALLSIKIHARFYEDLFFICAGIIHPWFFLAGVPHDLDAEPSDYPAVLRIFAQYILIPLVAIYVIILYLYAAKSLAQWQWPRFKSTYLVAVFSAPGILATLLLYPMAISAWAKKYTRLFYALLIPLVVLMLICIYRRVNEHGLTELMVVAIAMGFWLMFVSIFMLRSQGNNIRIVPVTLATILLLISFGPLSAPALGLASQTARFEALLTKIKLPGGKINLAQTKKIVLSNKDYIALTDKAHYLSQHFGTAGLTPFTTGGTLPQNSYEANNQVIQRFENSAPEKGSSPQSYYFSTNEQPVSIAGFSKLVRYTAYRGENDLDFSGKDYAIKIDWKKNLMLLTYGKARGEINLAKFYAELVKLNLKDGNATAKDMTRVFSLGKRKGKIYLTRLSGDSEVRDLEFTLLLP